MKQKIFSIVLFFLASTVGAQPTYDQAVNFRNSMFGLMSQSAAKLKKPEEYRVFSGEVAKLEPAAIKVFGLREKAGEFDVCINAAASAWSYWQNQMIAMRSLDAFSIAGAARTGFDFGNNYGLCTEQIETLYKPQSGLVGSAKKVEIRK